MCALKKIKHSKGAGMDDTVVKMLKNRGISITDWLLRIFNRCRETDIAPHDWNLVCIVLIYKGKGDIESANYRGISIFNIIKE